MQPNHFLKLPAVFTLCFLLGMQLTACSKKTTVHAASEQMPVVQQQTDPMQQAKKVYETAIKFAKGDGVVKDEAKAFQLMSQAAEQGYALAQHQLGMMYINGNGVKKDVNKAVPWFERAATQGVATSQLIMALFYERGEGGLEKDVNKSCQWVFKAARQSVAQAEYSAGICAENGLGMEKDIQIAKAWYQKSATHGFQAAEEKLAQLEAQEAGADTAKQIRPGQSDVPESESGSAQRIQAQDPERFTLQVSSTNALAKAKWFIIEHGLQGKAMEYASQGENGIIYKVIYGSYASRKEAEATIPSLPEDIRKARPWVRQFKFIQRDMVKG